MYGATHLADLTEEEFKENFLGFKRSDTDSYHGANSLKLQNDP